MRKLIPLAIILLLISCNKNELPKIDCSAKTNQITDVKKLIAGTYNWVYTRVTYFTFDTIDTPLKAKFSYKYVFKSNGQVDYFHNDTLIWSNNYVIDYEFKVTTYPLDSSTIVIINDKQTGQRKEFFRPYLCNDSARFYNPFNSIDYQLYFKRD